MSERTSIPVREVSAPEAAALIAEGALLLDVREPDEIAQGRAEEAVTIPLGSLPERAGELPGGRTIVCVCRSGSRSALAAAALVAAGYEAVNLDGGMHAWHDAGLVILRPNGTPGVVA